jgi:hypothetical protein
VKDTDEPAATETVVVPEPVAPLTLHLRALSVKTVTGELFGTGRMFWKSEPLAPLAVSVWKMSVEVISTETFRSNHTCERTVSLSDLAEGRKGDGGNSGGLHCRYDEI